jgi:EAL domain-containing protein (putative c-di-GMP-specific phosphodiesterase class I)
VAVKVRSSPSVRDLLATGGLRAVFQPIVELRTGTTIGYEALARGPRGSKLEMPDELFALALEEGVLERLDRECRSCALSSAVAAGLRGDDLLFLNVEPAGLNEGGVLDHMHEDRLSDVSVVVELTERALTARPREVLAAVRWLRERGCRIALDDVGVNPRSLGLMPFVSPDIIKLDRSITQGRADETTAARVINAVRAEAERSGAVILAEGIETEAHRRRAAAMGAQLGQGWLFGRPGELDLSTRKVRDPRGVDGIPPTSVPRRPPEEAPEATPFEQLTPGATVLLGDKQLLLSLSRQLEQEATAVKGEAIVLATFQDTRFFTAATRRRYERMAEGAALVGTLGVGLAGRPGIDVRGASLSDDDRLKGEWDVVVMGPHFAGAFVARDLGDTEPDAERRFEYFMTYDRERVAQAARPLLHRLLRTH